ncbi:dihydropteroate synthase [Omnitrophica bacterium]|nr:dihydropteroate synthase [Candidatus Omnitrophota bacterium]
MIIIGERINTSRAAVKRALEEKNSQFIQREAKAQIEHGAQYLDVNCGLSRDTEAQHMEWLVKTIREVTDASLCIDSPDPDVIKRGVLASTGKSLINSITAEESRYGKILPLGLEHNCGIIALTMDEGGMPDTAGGRVRIAQKLYKILRKTGIADDNIYFDPLVRPISSEPRQAEELLKAIPAIKALGAVKVVCGISNVSYGLPRRRLINSTFLSMALSAGMDGALLDPLDKITTAAIRAAEATLGKDKYCMNFIQGHRKGLF